MAHILANAQVHGCAITFGVIVGLLATKQFF